MFLNFKVESCAELPGLVFSLFPFEETTSGVPPTGWNTLTWRWAEVLAIQSHFVGAAFEKRSESPAAGPYRRGSGVTIRHVICTFAHLGPGRQSFT